MVLSRVPSFGRLRRYESHGVSLENARLYCHACDLLDNNHVALSEQSMARFASNVAPHRKRYQNARRAFKRSEIIKARVCQELHFVLPMFQDIIYVCRTCLRIILMMHKRKYIKQRP